MKPTQIPPFVALAAATCAATCAAADVIGPPEGFGLVPRHQTVISTYSANEASLQRTLSRPTIEAQCAMFRQSGMTTATPTFAPGAEEDDRIESWTFVSGRARAVYETIHGYACTNMSHAKFAMCDCAYHPDVTHRIHLRQAEGDGTRVIDIDVERGVGSQRLLPSPYQAAPAPGPSGGKADALAEMLAGPAVAHDTVAGLPCTLHRKDTGRNRTELCLADAADKLPAPMRGGELSRTVYVQGDAGLKVVARDVTRQVVPQAQVDAAVFDPPAGVRLETQGRRP